MLLELARVRLRGIYAIAAGAIFILIIPFFEATVLASSGYLTAIDQISQHHDFGPYLTWVGQNQDSDVLIHIVQFVAFLLAFPLAAMLRAILWPATSRGGLVARLAGQVGFACYALAVVLGLLVSGNSGSSYVNATTAGERSTLAAHFGSLYGLQNILAHIVGGLLVALALMLLSARMMRQGQRTIPTWLGYLGVLVAALLVVTALQYTAEPAAPETSISSLSFFGLAIFLISGGICLIRLHTLPATTGAPRTSQAAQTAKAANSVPADDDVQSDEAEAHQPPQAEDQPASSTPEETHH